MSRPVRSAALFGLCCSLLAFRAARAEPLSADDAVRAGLPRHPRVVEAEARHLAAQGETRSATFLRENPSLSIRVSAGSPEGEAEASQPLSLSGEGLFAHRAAAARKDAAEASWSRARMEAAAEIRHAWVAAVVAVERARLAREALGIAGRQVAAAEARAAAGEAPELDARLARLGRGQAADAFLSARREEAVALVDLGALVGRVVAPGDLPGDPCEGLPEASGGEHERSDVRAAGLELDAARAALHEARAAVLPAVELGAWAEQVGAERLIGPSLSVTLPLWQQNAAGRARARGELGVAAAEVERAELRAEAERSATTALALDAAEVVRSLGGQPSADADAAARSAEAGYLAGEIDLPTALFLQEEIRSSREAFLSAYASLADATIDHLLAAEDDSLLGVRP